MLKNVHRLLQLSSLLIKLYLKYVHTTIFAKIITSSRISWIGGKLSKILSVYCENFNVLWKVLKYFITEGLHKDKP
jgi:hypothetical protein